MFKVLLVDDEPLVLQGMSLFDWKSVGCELAGTAEDGSEAMQFVNGHHPDIVITDIRMPAMDGLSFAEQLHRADSDILVLISTGYSDFAYAQQALRAGVFDFLVKPVTEEVLQTALEKAVKVLQARNSQKHEEQQLKDLANKAWIANALAGDANTSGMLPSSEPCVVVALCVDNEENLEVYALRRLLDKELASLQNEVVLVSEFHRYLLAFRSGAGTDVLAFVKQTVESIQLGVWKEWRYTVSAGVSTVSSDPLQIPLLKQQALAMLHESQSKGKQMVSFASSDTGALGFSSQFIQAKAAICDALSLRDEEALRSACSLYKVAVSSLSEEESRKLGKALWSEALYLVNLPQDQLPVLEGWSVPEVRKGLQELLSCLLTEASAAAKDIAPIVSNYIKTHYQEDISLGSLSQELCYSTSYLSRLIHKREMKS